MRGGDDFAADVAWLVHQLGFAQADAERLVGAVYDADADPERLTDAEIEACLAVLRRQRERAGG